MLMLAATPACVAPTTVYVVAICALVTGIALGAFVGAIVTGEILTMRARRADPYAAPVDDVPHHMRSYFPKGGRQ